MRKIIGFGHRRALPLQLLQQQAVLLVHDREALLLLAQYR
jgi:hypothetical protein